MSLLVLAAQGSPAIVRLTPEPRAPGSGANDNQMASVLEHEPQDLPDGRPRSAGQPPPSGSAGADGQDDELALIARVGQGDQQACSLLIDRHLPRILGFAQRTLGQRGNRSDAEDVAQETFLRLWRNAGGWTDRGAKVGTWLHLVALNLCRDRLRRRPTMSLDVAPDRPSGALGPEGLLHQRQVQATVQAAVMALPERQRLAITLCHFQDLGNIEAAAVLEISVEALESLLARGRRSLAKTLAPTAADLLPDAMDDDE